MMVVNINNNFTITPVISYYNIEENKTVILRDTKNLSGVYLLYNKQKDKFYVGSAINLSARLRSYFSPQYLERVLSRNKSKISSALLKYGYSHFDLHILEYCDKDILLNREQYYIDLLVPPYNILKIAGSRLGIKSSLETLDKLKGRKHSLETINKISLAMKGRIPRSELRRINQLLATGHVVKVLNVESNITKIYNSIRLAANDIKISHTTILKYINTNKLIKNLYLITK
jgi:group I intron endonuclease